MNDALGIAVLVILHAVATTVALVVHGLALLVEVGQVPVLLAVHPQAAAKAAVLRRKMNNNNIMQPSTQTYRVV